MSHIYVLHMNRSIGIINTKSQKNINSIQNKFFKPLSGFLFCQNVLWIYLCRIYDNMYKYPNFSTNLGDLKILEK